MPQPRSTAGKSTSSARSGAKRATGTTKRATGTTKRASSASTAAKRTSSASTSAKRTSSASTSARARTQAKRAADGAGDVRLEAVAQRVRKLNERIIDAGKDAGETTLTAYEKALKAIASSLDRGAATSEVEWVSHLLSTQAKFLRDVTDSWTKAARGMLK